MLVSIVPADPVVRYRPWLTNQDVVKRYRRVGYACVGYAKRIEEGGITNLPFGLGPTPERGCIGQRILKDLTGEDHRDVHLELTAYMTVPCGVIAILDASELVGHIVRANDSRKSMGELVLALGFIGHYMISEANRILKEIPIE